VENILKVKNLNKVYKIGKGKQQQVLYNISLSIIAGEFVSVMGASGSGKSTLLYNISGMDRADSGSIHLCGKEINTMNEDVLDHLRLTKMGFIFQQSNLLKNLNIIDNIIYPAFAAKKDNRRSINSYAKKLMSLTGISALSDNDITQASGGQLQRAAICRALINKPTILFADEPTGALNSKATNEVMEILADINTGGTTIMLVTHDIGVAVKTERVLFMSDGVIAGEIVLGKYQKGADIKTRENKLSAWLSQKGF